MRSARRPAGILLCVGGVLLLAFAATTYSRGMIARDRVRRAWEAEEARRAVLIARQVTDLRRPLTAPVPGAPVARIQIPSVGLDEVVVEGIGDDELNAGPGHLPGSAFPGEPGNSIISAHRDRHFRALTGVQVGDTIMTDIGYHHVRWIVTSRRIVGKDAPALYSTAEPMLTLTTCWPVQYLGPAPDRLIIRAIPIRPPKHV